MRIAAVSPHVPYEGVTHAGGAYLLHHLEQLSVDHDVTLVVPGTPEVQEHLLHAPAWLDVVVVPFERAPLFVAARDRVRRRLRHRALGAPSLHGFRTAALDGIAAAADVVELHWGETALLAPWLRRRGVTTPIAVVEYDIDSEAAAARARLCGGWSRVTYAATHALRDRTERADLAAADLVLVFKTEDERKLRQLGVPARVKVVDPYLELPTDVTPVRGGASVLFTGALWRPENHDGVRWFLQEVWPAVLDGIPHATFTIAGADPPDALRALAEAARRVVVTGTVPSFAPYYRAARVFVAPLFVDGGLKFKVPQAMAYGLPVVATPTAAAGILDRAPAGTFWAVTRDAGDMAAALVDALGRPAAAAATGARAAAWCRANYGFDASTIEVVDAYRELVSWAA